MKNLLALGKIEYVLTKRNLSTFVLGVGLPVVLLFLITAMFSANLPAEIVKEQTKYFLISMAVYSSLSFAVFTFPTMFQEDRTTNWYLFINQSPVKMWQYYTMKVVRIMTNFVVAIVVVFLVGKFFKDIEMSLNEWLVSGLLISFGSICMLSFGFLLSLINSSEKLAVVANILYIVLGMIGGLWWPLDQFPDALAKVGKLTPTHHTRELAIQYITNNEIATESIIVLLFYAIILVTITLILRKKIEVK